MTIEPDGRMLGRDIERGLKRDDLIVITGAGGFIAGALTRYFHDLGYTRIRAVDRKPLPEWYQRVPGVESLRWISVTKRTPSAPSRAPSRSTTWRPTWAAWGSSSASGWSACAAFSSTRNLIEASYRAGARRYFFSSSACAYNTDLQKSPDAVRAQGGGRVSGDGRARLRVGEAAVGDVLPGILG